MLKRVLSAAVLLAATCAHAQMLVNDKFEVSASGAATYQIPVQVPPGIMGLEPQLSIAYNSQSGGSSLMTAGWGIGGFSTITRCPPMLVQDPGVFANGAVTFTNTDRYCLDGKRLLAIHGTDGADGTEYRTEIDSYKQVVSHTVAGVAGGPGYFIVKTKDGLTMEYANTADSRVMGTLASGAVDTAVATWAIDKITDRNGNYVTFSYTVDSANGQYYPATISYTGNATASPALSPVSSVTFVYEARTDIISRFTAGRISKTAKRLSKIVTQVNGAEVNEYRIGYLTNGIQPPVVNTVTMCDAAGNCLMPKTFWSGSFYSAPASQTWTTTNNWSSAANTLLGDFDGDGHTDIAVITNATTVNLKTSNGKAFTNTTLVVPAPGIGTGHWVGSVDGDPKSEIITYNGGKFYAYKWTAQGFVVIPGWNGVNPEVTNCCSTGTTWVGDFNGDGLSDILFANGTSVNILTAQLGGGFLWNRITSPVGISAGHAWVGDFNGDGKTDLVSASGGTITEFDSTGLNTFNIKTYTVPNNWGDSAHTFVGDFNGDGRADIATASGGNVYMNLSTGAGFVQQVWTTPNDWDSTNLWARDMNGDGKTDLITASGGTVHIKYSTGSAFYEANTTIPNTWGATGFTWMGDFNGDGAADIASASGANVYMTLTTPTSPSMVYDIMTSNSQDEMIIYNTLTQSLGQNYFVEFAPAYPQVALLNGMKVVTSTSTATNAPLIRLAETYVYHTGVAQTGTGRGFMGFAKMDVVDGATNLVSTTEFNQYFPWAGLPNNVYVTRNMAGVMGPYPTPWVSYKQYGYNCNGTLNGVNVGCDFSAHGMAGTVAQLTQNATTTKLWDLNGVMMPGNTVTYSNYDAYGNVGTQVTTVTNPDGSASPYSKTVVKSYYNDPSRWMLGLVTKEVTTSTGPDLPPVVKAGTGGLPPAPGGSVSPGVMSVILGLLLND